MTGRTNLDDRGQAFPVYIVAIVGLLFAALAFFVVGMAGATRSDAQGAADAAALAAAREARDGTFDGTDLSALKQADWEKILRGDWLLPKNACAKAADFATSNGASTVECDPHLPEFTVKVITNAPVGDSVVPGSSEMLGTATATAVIESRCSLRPGSVPTVEPSSKPSPGPGDTDAATETTFECDGRQLKLDPSKPGSLTQLARGLFTVRLVN
ncbi:pilus assembly protein TadG-related protein [Streptomyces sp. NPDC002602]|uniref:pilus assembly protein TadG-related protein n=1 Tax=Streptomyces sp. NPDC002602 TaxID=3364654 RepID=UPI00368C90F8